MHDVTGAGATDAAAVDYCNYAQQLGVVVAADHPALGLACMNHISAPLTLI